MAEQATTLQPDAAGRFVLSSVAHADVQRIDISDVDLVLTTKSGDRYIFPNGGISAMGDHPPDVVFSDGPIAVSQLLGEVGATLNLAVEVPMASTIKLEGDKLGGTSKDADLAQKLQKLEQKLHEQQKQIQKDQQQLHDQAQKIQQDQKQIQEQAQKAQQHDQDMQQKHAHDADNVSALSVNTESNVEQMVQNVQKLVENLHKSDYEYVPPKAYEPIEMPPSPPPGVPPPISLTPIVNLFMGNVVGTTTSTISGVNYFYGGGGAVGSDATSDIGPRDALQWSAATITGDNVNDVIYAEGPLVGNSDPATNNSAYYSKQFLLNVAGYFTTLNDITIKGVPTGVSIVGATNEGGGVWTLPASYVLQQQTFTLVYDTANYNPSGNNTFTIEFDISGATTRHATFSSVQTFEFEYMNVTNSSQVTDPTLVYDQGGISKEIYVLPTLDQPNIITAGNGDDIVYGSRSNDTITLGNGTDQVTEGDGNNTITLGNGVNSTISAGNGDNVIVVGSGSGMSITVGNGDNTITTAGGGGQITTGTGSNTITINSTASSTDTYTISTLGVGATNTIVGGDDKYNITMGTGTNTVTLGNSAGTGDGVSTFDTTISTDAGTNTIVVGNGAHEITIGAGVGAITTGTGNNTITTAGGGGSIATGTGNDVVTINSTSGSTDIYTMNLAAGNDTVAAGDDLYNITLGAGNNSVTLGNGTDTYNSQITLGAGSTTYVHTGNGRHTISVGASSTIIQTGAGNDAITTAGGGGTISAGSGNNTITINSTASSADTYTITTTGTGTNTVVAGDDDYTISMGAGTNNITLGNSAGSGNGVSTFNSTINAGAGTNTIVVGTGSHSITTGTGAASVTTGAGNNTITLADGGGSISTAQGNQVIQINSASTSTSNYRVTTSGTGTSNVTAYGGNYTIVLGSGANTVSVGSGTSSITASGSGVDTITTGDGNMTIVAGAGTANTISTGVGVVNITNGNGANSSITTSGGGGTIVDGNGANDTIGVGSGNYTITTGNGAGDHVTTGGGNNTINVGSGGSDVMTLGSGNNTVNMVAGTSNTITGGTGSNTINFTGVPTSALTILFGTTGTSSATGTGVSDSFTKFSTVYGSNNGDTITLNTGNLTVYAGSGNDTITLGSGIDIVYAGNGNNSIIGTSLTTSTGDMLYGGTGNNTFTLPDAGTTYNGTNNANMALVANNLAYTVSDTSATNPFAGGTASVSNVTLYSFTSSVTGATSSVVYSYASGVATIGLDLGVQLNKISYAADTSGLNVNLATGIGTGGTANASTYAFTPTSGYNSINDIIVGAGTNTLTPSYSDTVLIGGSARDIFNDANTTSTQTVVLVGGGSSTGSTYDSYTLGAAREIIVGSATGNDQISYNSSPAGVVINLDSVSHTFSSSLYANPVTVAAYSGTNWGANAANSSASWSTGDYYVPVSGLDTSINQVNGSGSYNNVFYSGSASTSYYGGSASDYFYGSSVGTGTALYGMSSGNDVAVGGSAFNVFYTATTVYNIYVVLNKALDPRAQDAGVNLTYAGVTYTGFAFGMGNVTNPLTNPLTYISGFENVLGQAGSDYIVGDNNGNQINAEAGSNTIILGSGTNIITAIQGNNTITSSSASGQTVGTNTLNFETTNNTYSGNMGTYSSAASAGVQVFLNNGTETTFFNSGTGGDQAAFWGGTSFDGFQARTSGNVYSAVQNNIITTLNGADYSSGTTNTGTTSTFTFDNVYSGASIIRGHGGSSIFFDNMGSGAEALYGGSGSNVYYLTPTQAAASNVTISGVTNVLDILRVEGWGATTTSGNAFGSTDPFTSNTRMTSIDVLDVRSGADTVNTTASTITLGANSTTNTSHPTFNLSATDIQNLTSVSSTPTLALKLDSGDIFQPTGTLSTVVSGNTTSYYNSTTVHTSATLIATDTYTSTNYYTDVVVFNSSNTAHLNIHYGS